MSKIEWKLPGPDDAGFLRRRHELTVLLDAEPTPANDQAILDFLTPYVEDPDTLLDCSRREYGDAVLTLLGLKHSVSEKKGGKSGE